ncbi:MAG TPA: DUF2889 domain-containing protein [Candidatus Binatia bacterium]|nr:DUF2889 domain-containing protein [Candidatus Binatia bacterium]
MHLDVRGHPLHSRALSVVIHAGRGGLLDVHATLLDLRKRGFVPVAGDLQGAGIIHHMELAAVVDAATGVVRTIAAAQPSVAFEPTAVTGGESCRDPIHAVEALAGTPLGAGFARRTADVLGGPRGCSHILTLTHLLGSTVAWALAHCDLAAAWRPGERVFRRDVVVDGVEPDEPAVQLAAQTTDLHLAAAAPDARPMDRFGAARELRVLARVELPSFALLGLEAMERVRTAADLATASWQDRGAALAPLAGVRMGPGVTAMLLERLGGTPADRPLLDTLLMLAPALVQCVAALSERFPEVARMNPTRVGIGGLPDSCWMWRRDGALQRVRDAEAGATPARAPR